MFILFIEQNTSKSYNKWYWIIENILTLMQKVLKCCNERKMAKCFQQSWKCLSLSFETKNGYVFFGGQKFVYVFKNHFQVKMAKFF